MNKFSRSLLGLVAAVAATGAMAQNDVDMNARLAASGNLVAVPNPLVVSDPFGMAMFRSVTVTDNGAGLANNLSVSIQRTMGSLGQMHITSDSCSNSSLGGPDGTCTIKLGFSGTCPKPETSKWNLIITSTTAPTLIVPVTLASTGGQCL